jgi:CubicO group peptidase (beta-lactamase class C family)
MQDYEIPGLSIALIEEGETVWRQAYGYADLSTGRELTVDTYCRMESISKPVTAWGVMKLIEEGRIDPEAPAQRYLETWKIPETKYAEEKVTVRRLLSGNAGMPLGSIGVRYSPGSEDIPGLQEVLSREAFLFREPGSGFFYSNTGFNILELLIEEVTGRDFAAYMDEEILEPLGMNRAGFEWSEDFDPPVPNGYGGSGEPIPVYVYPYDAAGDLFATIDDVTRFAAAAMPSFGSTHRGVLSPEAIETMHSPVSEMSGYYRLVFDGYGLGHFVEHVPRADSGQSSREHLRVVSHGGQGSGWMTDFHVVPETGDGIVILSNSQRTWPAFAYILSDWAGWIGLDSIGMGIIVTVQKIAWAVVAAVLFLLVLQILRLGDGVISGRRRCALRFPPESPGHIRLQLRRRQGKRPLQGRPLRRRLLRVLQFAFALVLFGIYLRITTLDYWFLDSVLPIATRWLDFSLLSSAVVLLASALLPSTEPNGRRSSGEPER